MNVNHNNSISVVIPTYNRASCIARAVESVLDQRQHLKELIVVDDGSTDNTRDVLNKYQKYIKAIYQNNLGVSAARNAGIRQSLGTWISFLDSDDWWLPGMAESLKVCSLEHEVVGIISNGLILRKEVSSKLFDERGINWYSEPTVVSGVKAALLQPLTSGVVLRKDVLDNTNGFDVNCRFYEDYDLWTRVANYGEWLINPHLGFSLDRSTMSTDNVSHQYHLDQKKMYFSLYNSTRRLLNLEVVDQTERQQARRQCATYFMKYCESQTGRSEILKRLDLLSGWSLDPSLKGVVRLFAKILL